MLFEHPRIQGYQMFKVIKGLSDNKILVKEGSIYPTLHLLTKQGTLTVEDEMIGKRFRKYYKISKKGKRTLSQLSEELLDFTKTLNSFFKPKADAI